MGDMIERLQHCALFAGITQQEIEALLGCLRPVRRTYPKDAVIWHEGERVQSVGLVLSGRAVILRDDFWGNRSILGESAAGDLFGESYACAPGVPLTVSVIAAEDCEVLFINIAQALTMCTHVCAFHVRLVNNLMHILAGKNLMLSRKIDHLSRRSTREKLLAYLSDQAEAQGSSSFDIPFNRQELADYLSVDRSALSQVLSCMKREGLLDFQRSHFTLFTDRSEP